MRTAQKARKCLICEVRPASEQGYCKHCISQIEAEKRRKIQPQPFRYVTYQGITFEFHNGNGHKLTPVLTTRNPETLPQKLLINLNQYCEGFTREQVKKLKRLCLSFAKS
jgi:hypothetical protein